MMAAALPSNVVTSWMGEESVRWEQFLQRSKALQDGGMPTDVLLGNAGIKVFEANAQRAKKRERRRAIYGDD